MITLFAACDYNYFFEHGLAFAKSGIKAGHRVYISIFADITKDYNVQTKQLITFLTETFYKKVSSDLLEIRIIPKATLEEYEKVVNITERRAYYASIRFMILPEVLEYEYQNYGNSVLVLDIDSVINKRIKIAKKNDLGLFLRENENLGSSVYEKAGMKIAAGAVYVGYRSMPFVEAVSEAMFKIPKQWFCDQLVLHQAYQKYKNDYNIINFDNKFLDWEFENPKALIYTGKGARKVSEPYLKLRDEIIKDD